MSYTTLEVRSETCKEGYRDTCNHVCVCTKESLKQLLTESIPPFRLNPPLDGPGVITSRCVCQYLHDIQLHINFVKLNWQHGAQYHFDDEVKGGRSWYFHTRNDATSSRNMNRNIFWRCYRQKNTGHPIIKDVVYFEYKVSGVMCSVWMNAF